MTVDPEGLRYLASECVALVKAEFGRDLNWELDSLTELDAVCAQLLVHGPLVGERLDLWWKLAGAYTGEVVVHAYEGRWVKHEKAPGAFAVAVEGTVGFPFAVVDRVLRGEPFKSIASFGRVFPHIAERGGGTA
jgi:hypothetical protein